MEKTPQEKLRELTNSTLNKMAFVFLISIAAVMCMVAMAADTYSEETKYLMYTLIIIIAILGSFSLHWLVEDHTKNSKKLIIEEKDEADRSYNKPEGYSKN